MRGIESEESQEVISGRPNLSLEGSSLLPFLPVTVEESRDKELYRPIDVGEMNQTHKKRSRV